jgi:TetR/AcrR family transcriptional repressor of nem operon
MNNSREHILLTSLQLFLKKGYKEVTMKEIVDKSRFSKGAFYHYFNSKEQLFEQVIEFFLGEFTNTDEQKLPDTGLKEFYTAYIKDLKKKTGPGGMLSIVSGESFSVNHFYLIFDALRLIPSFKNKHQKQHQNEVKTWTNIVAKARKQGEINTRMTDEEVAKMFIYISDGFGIHSIMNSRKFDARQLQALFDGLYKNITK